MQIFSASKLADAISVEDRGAQLAHPKLLRNHLLPEGAGEIPKTLLYSFTEVQSSAERLGQWEPGM